MEQNGYIKKELVKTDRNGTKYYNIIKTCPKCGGNGYIYGFSHVYGGICFDCNGSGVIHAKEKEYTPEYEAKLLERRAARQAKKEAEQTVMNLQKAAKMFPENMAYFVLGETYSIKEELKAKGAKFDWYNRMWYFNYKAEGYELYPVEINPETYNINTFEFKIDLWQKFKRKGAK